MTTPALEPWMEGDQYAFTPAWFQPIHELHQSAEDDDTAYPVDGDYLASERKRLDAWKVEWYTGGKVER